MSDNTQDQRPRGNVFQEYSMVLLSEPVAGAEKPPRFTIGLYRNRPTISVRTNAPNDQGNDNGRIQANPTIPDFYAFLRVLESLAKTKGERKFTATLKARTYGKGGLSPDKRVNAKLIFGRDRNDVIYIAVLHWNKDRPVIKFPFLPQNDNSSETNWGDAQGQPLSNAEISEFYTLGWIDAVRGFMGTLLPDNYVPPAPRNSGNGNGGGQRQQGGYNNNNRGGYQNNGGGNSSYSNSNAGSNSDDSLSFGDDDLPY